MKRYGEYKDSGIPWIGEIPKDWEVSKVKYRFIVVNGATPKSGEASYWDGDITWITPADYKTENVFITDSRKKITAEGLNSCGTTLVPRNSIIVSNRAPIGSVGLANIELCTNQGCKSLVKHDTINEKYIFYFFSIMSDPLNMLGRGTTFLELSSSDLASFNIPLPPNKVQESIAYYIDTKTIAIDTLITDKQKLIDLLKEKRQAIISEAVTKGLDKNAKMKDSGVEWIGEISEGWRVVKLKYLSNIKRGASPRPIDDPIYFDDNGERYWVRISDVTGSRKYLLYCEQKLSELGISKSVCINEGDLFVSICASVGKPCISKIKACIHDGFVLFDDLDNKLTDYIYYLFESGLPYKGLGKLGTQLNLNTETIGNIFIPIHEHIDSIVIHILEKTMKIDALITDIQTQIEKLKEYRQSIISEAVTGKVAI